MDLNPIRLLVKAEDQTAQAFSSVQKRIGALESASSIATGALQKMAGPLTVAGLVAVGRSALNSAAEVAVLSQRMGVSAETLSQFRYVAEQSGTDFRTLAKAVQLSQKAVSESARGIGEARAAMVMLHLDAKKLQSMKPEAAFEAIGDALSRLPDAADRTAVAMKVFGEAGAAVIPVFADGAAGVRKLREDADALGITMKDGTALAAQKANDAIARMGAAARAAGVEFASSLAPGIEAAANASATWLAKLHQYADRVSALGAAPKEVREEHERLIRTLGMKPADDWFDAWLADSTRKVEEFASGWNSMIAAISSRPLLPGLTAAGMQAKGAVDANRAAQMVKDLKSIEVATDGLTDSERSYFMQLERTVQIAQQRSADEQYAIELTRELMDTDQQAAQKAIDKQSELADQIRKTRYEQERLQRESTLTWQLMETGLQNVSNQLSNNLAAAIAGARVKLLDLASLAESILSLAFRYAISAGVNQIFPGAGFLGGIVAGGPGGTPSGSPAGNKAMGAGASTASYGPKSGGVNLTVNVRGILDPANPISVRKITNVMYEELLKIQRHHGPMPARAQGAR